MDEVIVDGYVYDAENRLLIPHAKVFATFRDWKNYRETTTNVEGYFCFKAEAELAEGWHTLDVFSPGFARGLAGFVVGKHSTHVDVFLSVLPEVQEEEIVVQGAN